MSSPTFQPITVTYGAANTEVTFNDIDAQSGVFTYREASESLPMSSCGRLVASLTRPSGKSNYYVARINLQQPVVDSVDGSIKHVGFFSIESKVHKDAVAADAKNLVERAIALLQSADLSTMLTELSSLR